MKNWKKGLSALLALVMLVMAVPFGGLTAFASATDGGPIYLDDPINAWIGTGGEIMAFEFTPEEDGQYSFFSNSDADTYGYIYDKQGSCLAFDDDSGTDSNFRVICELTAGVTYELHARYFNSDQTGKFEVCVSKYGSRLIDRIHFYNWTVNPEDCHIEQTTLEETGEIVLWKRYDWLLLYDVYYTDGTVAESRNDYWVEDDNGSYYLNIEDGQSAETPWSVGANTINVTVEALDLNTSFQVYVNKSSIASVEVEPIQLIENANGYYTTGNIYDDESGEWVESPEYFRYDVPYPYNAVITYEDGRVIEGSSIQWGDYYYSIGTYSYDQNYENRWTAGNTYEIQAHLLDYTFTYQVEIIESPVESVTVEPIFRIENYDGYYKTDEIWDEEKDEYVYSPEYFYYDDFGPTWENTVITLKDGTVIEGTEFEWNGEWYSIQLNDAHQNYENRWTVGNTYQINAEIAGYKFTYDVQIVETPVERVEVKPIVYIKGTNGSYTQDSEWDEDLGDWVYSPEYFFYHFYQRQFTTYLKDGSVFEGDGFEWNGRYFSAYDIANEDDQSYENQWDIGTHTQSKRLAGYDFDFTVEIVESPVASVTVEPITRMEGDDGYLTYDEYWDEELGEYITTPEYFYYHTPWPNDDNIVITLKDGTVIRGTAFQLNDQWFDLSVRSTNQSYENRWTAGNTYELTGEIAGYKFTYTVEIVESPVASVTVEPITRLEGSNGSLTYDEYWDEELGEYVTTPEYFYYHLPWPNRDTTVITLKDGTVINGTEFEWNGKYYSMGVYDSNQNYNNQWTAGNTYELTGEIAGHKFTYTVEIIESPVESVVIEPVRIVENTNGYYTYDSIEDPEEGYISSPEYFRYLTPWPEDVVITLKDGTVIEGTNFYWNGDWYSMSIYEPDQSYENQWTAGNTYEMRGSILGYEFTYPVEIIQLSANGSFEYMESADGIIITDSYIAPETLEIPAEIDGKPVIGVAGLCGYDAVKHLIFPDSVQTIGDYVINGFNSLETVTFGNSVRNLRSDMFAYAYNLSDITVAENNAYFCAVDGVLYNKAMTKVLAFPINKGDSYEVPKTVTDISALDHAIYGSLEITFPADHPYFVTVDGVTYNKNMTKVLFCSKDKAGSYTMPDTVTEIAASAFQGCDQLTEVIVSSQVTEIVYCVFSSCASLEKVELPSGLVSIDERAFENTEALESIELPEGLKYIGPMAFMSSGLTSLKVPNSVGIIDYSAFKGSNIATLDLGNGIAEIYESAFANTPVTAVVLPDSLQWLGSSAFEGCSELKTLSIGSGLSRISDWCFSHTGLESVSIPGTIQDIGEAAFAWSALARLELNEGIIAIEGGAFRDCDNLKEVTIPDSVKAIGAFAFYDCSNLNTVVIGDGVDGVGVCAFAYCPLTSLDLGDSLPYIPSYAFENTDLPTVFIPDSVTDIMYGAFMDCSELTSIELPLSVESIGFDAFANCESLTDVYYQGTEEDRANIEIDEWGNEYLLNATWHYGWTNEKWDGEITEPDVPPVEPDVPPVEPDVPPVECDHVYDNNCDPDCNLCGEIRNDMSNHVYDNACDVDCNECGEFRKPANHVYDNACDVDCNECGEFREVGDHVYDDEYDADCNECGDIREVPERPVEPDVPPVTDGPLFIVDNATAKAGDTFTVALRTENNSGIVSLKVDVGYDADLLELIAIEGQDFSGTSFGPLTNNPIAVNWLNAISSNNTTNGVVALLTFRVKDTATVGSTAITLSYYYKDVYDFELNYVTFDTEDGTVEIIEYMSGDVDDDGEITNRDLGFLQRYINGWDVEINELAGDVDRDGELTNRDLGILQRYINGWNVELL